MKKAVKIFLWSLLVLIVVVGVYMWSVFGSLVKGAMSVEKLDEGIYYMEYEGDDGTCDERQYINEKDIDRATETCHAFVDTRLQLAGLIAC